jgi:hypothetical protein
MQKWQRGWLALVFLVVFAEHHCFMLALCILTRQVTWQPLLCICVMLAGDLAMKDTLV